MCVCVCVCVCMCICVMCVCVRCGRGGKSTLSITCKYTYHQQMVASIINTFACVQHYAGMHIKMTFTQLSMPNKDT